MVLKVKDIIDICGGKLLSGEMDKEIKTFSKDTRIIKQSDCYVGIKGESFDGNLFWKEAKSKGASSCILDEFNDEVPEDFTIIKVDDSVKAIQELAKYVRTKKNIPVVAITGSVGKTSTKDMIASILSTKYKVLKTEGNLNGQIGLPLSILSLTDEEVMVLEMGMNNFGQISLLTDIAKPTIAVITNIGTAHIGILGSRENILKSKLEILEGMQPFSDLVINNDNDLLSKLELDNYKIHKCSIKNNGEYLAEDINYIDSKSNYKFIYGNIVKEINLPIMGEAFVSNSLLAIAVGDILNVDIDDIKKGLESIKLTSNRMEIVKLKNNSIILNDTYNSNYEAVESALKILSNYKGKRKIAVLGDILELEEFSEKIHSDIGLIPEIKKVDLILLNGNYAKFIGISAIKNGVLEEKVKHFENKVDLINYLNRSIKDEDVILVKASHGMNFKEIVDKVKEYNG